MINLSRPFINRPKATALLVTGFFAWGILSYFRLPIDVLPDIALPTIDITTGLPGASPETMASAVASPLERALANIPSVTSMTSTSALGKTDIIVQFDLNRDIDAAAQDIQAAISSAGGQLPKDLPSPPFFEKIDPNGFVLMSLAVSSETMPKTVLYDYIDSILVRQIARMPGVGLVDYHGDRVPAVRVQINPVALAARGLDLEDVRASLVQSTVNSPKGTLEGDKQSLLIRSNDQLLNAEPYNSQIIAWRNGSPIRIRDVGQAIDAARDTKSLAWANEVSATIIDIHEQSGARVDTTALVDRIKANLPAFRQSLPPSINVTVITDHSQTTRASLRDVQVTLGITVVLVALVIFVFLRDPKATLIPAISIPLSLVGSFIFMDFFGFNLDNISLMGLTIAVGFVVDDAIVVMENIVRHFEMGKSRRQAALEGAQEVGFTVITMTLSLIAVFLPLLLMGGIIGRLFREFAVTVSVALILSVVVSLTQTPVSCSLFLEPAGKRSHGRLYKLTDKGFAWLLDLYRRGLAWILGRPRLGLGVTVALALGSIALFVVVPKGFIPEQDTGLLRVVVEGIPGIPLPDIVAKVHQVAEITMRDPDVGYISTFLEQDQAANAGRMSVNLKPFAERKSTGADVIARLQPQMKKIPGIKVYFKAIQNIQIGTRGSKTQYQYVLEDGDIDELNRWSQILQDKLETLPQLTDVASDLSSPAPSVSVVVDRDKAASYGISPDAVDQNLYDAFGQRQVATIFSQLNQHRVVLEVQPNWHLDKESLAALRLRSPKTGQLVPLSAISHLESSISPMSISHQGSYPAVTLSFNLAKGASLGDAVDSIKRLETELKRPPGLTTSFQGSAQAFQDSLSSQPLLIASAIAVVYIILGVLYESFIHPITILSSLPSAAFGALAAMILFHYDLSVITLIALILLVGIVKKNAIMMVDVALHLQRESGVPAQEAIYEACLLRFRPIMMTTMSALLGALPLAIGAGSGSELRRPLGVAILGGLIVSQSVTLFTVPIIFLYMERAAQWAHRRRLRLPQPAAQPAR